MIGIESDNLDARLELGRALYESRDIEGAVRETEEILKRDRNHVDALYNLGAIYANENQSDVAVGYWKQAVEVSPDSESGRNSKRGLDILSGNAKAIPAIPEQRNVNIPDIPEHRKLNIPDIPEHRNVGQQPRRFDRDAKKALIDFITKEHVTKESKSP